MSREISPYEPEVNVDTLYTGENPNELFSQFNRLFPEPSKVPETVIEELMLFHPHPENQLLCATINGMRWEQISSDVIKATYPSFYVMSNHMFAYYFPAVIRYVLESGDVQPAEDLCYRMFKKKENRDVLRYRFRINDEKMCFLKHFFKWVLLQPVFSHSECKEINNAIHMIENE